MHTTINILSGGMLYNVIELMEATFLNSSNLGSDSEDIYQVQDNELNIACPHSDTVVLKRWRESEKERARERERGIRTDADPGSPWITACGHLYCR